VVIVKLESGILYSEKTSPVRDSGVSEIGVLRAGTFIDYTGLDGCGFVLRVGTEVYEPVIMPELDFEIEDGMEVCLAFEEYPAATICMVGVTIEITSCEVYVPCE